MTNNSLPFNAAQSFPDKDDDDFEELGMENLETLRCQTMILLNHIIYTQIELGENEISKWQAHGKVVKQYRNFHENARKILGVGLPEEILKAYPTTGPRVEVSVEEKMEEAIAQHEKHNALTKGLAPEGFQLSDNQTRFLISEFARQPTPDDAHLARLARELPGATVEGVREWFATQRTKFRKLNGEVGEMRWGPTYNDTTTNTGHWHGTTSLTSIHEVADFATHPTYQLPPCLPQTTARIDLITGLCTINPASSSHQYSITPSTGMFDTDGVPDLSCGSNKSQSVAYFESECSDREIASLPESKGEYDGDDIISVEDGFILLNSKDSHEEEFGK